MIRRCLKAQLWLALLLGATAAMAATATDNDYVAVAKKLIRYINADDQDRIHQLLASTLRGAFPEAKARPYFRNIIAQRGKLVRVRTRSSTTTARACRWKPNAAIGTWR